MLPNSALCFDGLTLVISPLISLMKDQVDQLQANGIEADFLNSSQTLEQQQVQNKLISGQQTTLCVARKSDDEQFLSTYFL